ncbi:nucleotidyltransferase family protein [Sphingomonas sp. SUN039]|uniref:nucleotidyltransferase family protein n=1 Tax=Sphingomonas sp. SUN039 TaxID=2937787 RepID=UPI0021647F4A|nr:nucleotidyltransferase family protein [Sphingomonas sp. SUN039]UVO53552.1 nucleotidyltransferase family protein [Sphingomonas sp. SUN039]
MTGAPVPKTAMVMAAGLGKRMRPLTATRPKPLVEVAGGALIDHVLARLAAAGVERAVVNVHYLADALEAHLKRHNHGLDIAISDERAKLLETGGGLIKALPLIDADPFIQVNSDNFWVDGPIDTFDLLAQRWNDATMDALLLLVPLARANCHGGKGDFHMDAGGLISRRKVGRIAPFVWTGVQMLSQRLIADPPADAFSTNVFWDRAIAAGRCYGVVHQGLWFDVGSPPAIAKTEAMLADA